MEKLFETLILAAFFGAFLKVIAHRIGVPAIVTLLLGGILLGPYFLKVIQPDNLGEGLRPIISICLGIILFEGGLSLEVEGYKHSPLIIRRLLTIGILITWLITALLAKLLLDFSIVYALLIGSMVIVTGPTVISPLLQRIKVKYNLKHILNWEAVLIDPIGVFITILCFEWLIVEGTVVNQLVNFSIRFITGAGVGVASGFFLYFLLNRRIIPVAHNITFTLSFVLLMYFFSNYISSESGLLTVVVAGFTFGIKQPHGIRPIKHFKLELSELALAVLFILLAANLNLDYFLHLHKKELLLIILVVFFIRPLSIFLCSYNTSLTLKEKLFLSWIAPRGIVAASMASLFALELRIIGQENADFIEVFVYSVIILTVIIQGFTADYLSKLLKLKIEEENGWLIVGAHRLSRYLALAIEEQTREKCFIIDTNIKSVYNARDKGLKAFQSDALIPEDLSTEIMSTIRNILVLTDNEELNVLICEKWRSFIRRDKMFRWAENLLENKYSGQPIWVSVSKPSQVSVELKKRTLQIDTLEENNMMLIKLSDRVLFEISGKDKKIKLIK